MKKILSIIILFILLIIIILLYIFNIIPHKKYLAKDFDIEIYKSNIDMDNDGTDDQSDILYNAKEYIKKRPKYKSKYYNSGYPDDEYGVCTDVVGYALLNSGYDLRSLVNVDIINNKDEYNIDKIDDRIDFRRVRNLKIYFDRNSINLSKDIHDISSFQGGDIIVFKNHIGIVSDIRNSKGYPFIIHHVSHYQTKYEEDILEFYGEILGHYRIS